MDEKRKETYFLVFGVILVSCVYGYAFYSVYFYESPEIMVVKIFDTYHHNYENGETATEIWTYGYGKFHFIGNHTFEVEQSYWIQYTTTPRSSRPFVWLKILEYREVDY